MVTVLRDGGLRFVIYRDDHEPPHVHVFGDGETKVELGVASNGMRLVYARGVNRNERRRVEACVRDNHAYLLARWSELHG